MEDDDDGEARAQVPRGDGARARKVNNDRRVATYVCRNCSFVGVLLWICRPGFVGFFLLQIIILLFEFNHNFFFKCVDLRASKLSVCEYSWLLDNNVLLWIWRPFFVFIIVSVANYLSYCLPEFITIVLVVC